jgi:hypothetical protein
MQGNPHIIRTYILGPNIKGKTAESCGSAALWVVSGGSLAGKCVDSVNALLSLRFGYPGGVSADWPCSKSTPR